MKNAICIILLSIIATVGFSQIQSSCEKSKELVQYYEKDVAYLAFKRLQQTKSVDTNKILIPKIYQDSIWNGIAAIYNAYPNEQRDSIFDIYCIHNSLQSGSPLYTGIFVELDTFYYWTRNWLNGYIETGYLALDAFISLYQFDLLFIDTSLNIVLIGSDLPINPKPVVDSLFLFDGIIDAFLDDLEYDGNKIEYSIDGDEQFYDFTLAWGDCSTGCIYRHKWSFKVNYPSCTVEYLGLNSNSEGEFPDPLNCNITSVNQLEGINSKVLIFPNPTSDFLNITSENIADVELWNTQRKIKQTQFDKQDFIKLDFKKLEPGLYFIKVKTDKNTFIRKVIKN